MKALSCISLSILLCSCTTVEVTAPDGTKTKTTSFDKDAAQVIGALALQGVAIGAARQLPTGYSK